MNKLSKEELLKNPKVVEEINRHKWFKSEKAGRDIGFEAACEDWIKNFSQNWLNKNCSDKKPAGACCTGTTAKKRSAKAYL